MKTLYTFLIITIGLAGCNTITDPAPEDPLVPSQVMQLIEKNYEKPQDVVFTELLEKKIWDVRFQSQAKNYNLILSPDNIKVSYRLSGQDVPDSLRNLLHISSIAGGTFSNFKQQDYISFTNFNFDKIFLANYFWKDQRYLVSWATIVWEKGIKYVVEMSPVSARFPTTDSTDLPDELQRYLLTKNYQFTNATILIANDSKKSYRVWVNKAKVDFELLFDQEYKLVAGSDKPVRIETADELPESIKAYIKRVNESQELGMTVEPVEMTKKELDGVSSYVVIFRNQKTPDNWTEGWYIIFDQNGKPLLRFYNLN